MNKTRVTFRQDADPGERFGKHVFDSAIGRIMPISGKYSSFEGTLVAAAVAEDGSYVMFTVDFDPGTVSIEDVVP